MTTFTWKVANLERNLPENKVYTVHYTVNALSDQVDPNSESGGFYSAGAYGSAGFDGEVTVDFADLTEEVVIGWVKDQFGEEKVAEIEAALQAQIDERVAPTKAAGVPWYTLNPFRTMIALIRPVLMSFLGSDKVKRLIVDMLRKLAEQSDNTVDDQAVDFIERGLCGC